MKNVLFVFKLGFALLVPVQALGANENVSYNRDVRPLLSARCFSCHGPDAESRESGLRLDQAGGDEGAYQSAIVPGSIEDSEVWNRITSDDESVRMPPPESHLKSLSKDEQNLIRQWIQSGANYEIHWAFIAPKTTLSRMHTADRNERDAQPIDHFVLERLKSEEMQRSVEADPRTLIRRVTFDLTGLPPTRDEVHAFLQATESSPQHAWQYLVDELLARPQYGEHMARYWLDLVRYADTNGMHKDFYRNHVAYRDWVIRAFNENLPYDDFLKYQLAGDLYDKPTQDQLVASGFHRLHLIIDRGTALPEESFIKNVVDRVTTVGTAFMGLTVHCAQCHDHKFDPITQKDFYSLSAFFNNIDAKPETVSGKGPKSGLQPPFVSLATPSQEERLQLFNKAINQLQVLKPLAETLNAGKESDDLIQQLSKEREKFDGTIPKAMVMQERKGIRPTFLLERGQYDAPAALVTRGTPAFLPPLNQSDENASRMDLAEWFVDPNHPLTARVAANRFWQQFFGVGLVKTSEDLGNQGEIPSHPELLDHLAVEFMRSGWDTKALIRQIVMSKTYRQASTAPTQRFQADADNRLLARGPRFRLDAEMIRDQILATSGLLSKKMYGPSVKPPQPAGLWKAVSMIGERFRADQGEAIRRRSVYTFWKRSIPPPQMTIFNAPMRDSCIARRERTNTPTQALLLLNEPEYFKAAQALAKRTLNQPADQRLDFIWETVTSKLPDQHEASVVKKLLVDLQKQYTAIPQLARQMAGHGETPDGSKHATDSTAEGKAELAAWTVVGNMLYNLDLTKTRN